MFGVWCFVLPLQALQHTSSCGAKARTEESDTESAEARIEESDTRGDTKAEANGEGRSRTGRNISGYEAIQGRTYVAGGLDSGERPWVIL